MKLSMMSYTLARQRPKGERLDVPAMCRLTRELRMEGIDFCALHGYKPGEIREIASDHGLTAVCYTFPADINWPDGDRRQAGVDVIRKGIEVASVLGTDKVMLPTPGKSGVPRNQSRRNIIEGLKEAAPFASEAGVRLTVENFPGASSPFVTADDMLEAVREVPGLRLTYDNGNAFTGEDPAESFRRCAAHVVHAHFKDWVKAAGDEGQRMLNGNRYRPALIGEGVVDQRRCLQAMKEAGYSGFINIEYEGDDYPAAEAVRRAVGYLRRLMAEVDGEDGRTR